MFSRARDQERRERPTSTPLMYGVEGKEKNCFIITAIFLSVSSHRSCRSDAVFMLLLTTMLQHDRGPVAFRWSGAAAQATVRRSGGHGDIIPCSGSRRLNNTRAYSNEKKK